MNGKRKNNFVKAKQNFDGINCGKSTNTMGQTDLLEDLVGMVGLDGDPDDEVIEIGSDYPYNNEIKSPKMRGSRDKNKQARYANGWKDVNRNSNIIRPGSSTNATIRD
jgi:hypothetical protein